MIRSSSSIDKDFSSRNNIIHSQKQSNKKNHLRNQDEFYCFCFFILPLLEILKSIDNVFYLEKTCTTKRLQSSLPAAPKKTAFFIYFFFDEMDRQHLPTQSFLEEKRCEKFFQQIYSKINHRNTTVQGKSQNFDNQIRYQNHQGMFQLDYVCKFCPIANLYIL